MRAAETAPAPARLLPSGDAYFLLDGAERELLVPGRAGHRRPGEPFTVFNPAGRNDPRAARRGSTELAFQSFFAADTSTHTTPLLPSWSAITVSEGALLSSTMVPPAARAPAIRCSATSGAT